MKRMSSSESRGVASSDCRPDPSTATAAESGLSAATIREEDIAIPTAGPAPGPSVAAPQPQPKSTDNNHPATPPQSPYTAERTALRNLTMPTHPNFSIPSSPSPPPQNSEAALALSTTTKKFDRFLELKKQGVHFNARLEGSSALRNPGLLPKLMEFAGIGEEEGYASTLDEGGVPTRWPEEWYVEGLVKENEWRERKAKGARTEVGFVKARSAASSASGTPKGAGGGGSEHRKSKFERR